MKKNLALLVLTGVLILSACGPVAVPEVGFGEVAAPQAGDSWVTTPTPAQPASPDLPPVTTIGPELPEQSWTEVTAYTAQRPESGGPCTATAAKLDSGQVNIVSVGCAGLSFATVHIVEASGRDTPQLIGPQNLIITQRAQNVAIAEPTFKVLIDGQQIWP